MKKTAIVVPHTHWDREWRYPLWKNRAVLVEMMDQLLETLESDPAFTCFVMDGQVVVVEDYVEIRPEHHDRVRELVKAGRLVIGPWYTLPDLYPLQGECLARNLLKGIRISNKFGGHLGVGYNSFGWGQTAQFPQFYKEFGFDFLIAAKRVSKARAPHCEFLWEGPDGTRLLTTRLGEHARANLYFFAYTPIRHGIDYLDDANYKLKWSQAGLITHNASPEKAHEDYFRLETPEAYHGEKVKETFQAAWDSMSETLCPDFRLIMNGSDFTDCQPSLTRMMADANQAFDDIEWKHGTLEEAAAGMRERLRDEDLPVVRGELRDGPPSHCSANALTTRMYIKLLNKQAENALIQAAEPLLSLLSLHGRPQPTRFLDLAWDFLLKSHPHDSINGVTQDCTAEDTVDRLRQVVQIAEVMRDDAMADLIRRIDLSSFAPEDILVVIFNPSPRPRREMVPLVVDTPQEFSIWDFELEDADGNRCPVQTNSREEITCPVNDLTARPWPFRLDRHRGVADPGEIPAGGYAVYRVVPTRRFNRLGEWWPEMRTSHGHELSQDPLGMENEFLRVRFQSDGTLDLEDKRSGQVHRGIHSFEDSGDVGDYWAHYPPYENQTISSRGQPARIVREENGPLACVFRVDLRLDLPVAADRPVAGIRGKSRRHAETRELRISSRFTLRKEARVLEIRTTVENTVEDHRMRLLLPTDIAATVSHAAGHFTVDERPVKPEGEQYPEMLTHPMASFVDLSDGTHGLGVVSKSFTEFETLRDDRHTLALTLFRAVRNHICTEFRSSGSFPMQKGGQCLREMTFEYAIAPHVGNWVAGDLVREAEKLNTELSLCQTRRHDHGTWPLRKSLYAVEPSTLAFSAFKKAEDSENTVLRLYNPSSDSLQARVSLPESVRKVWLMSMNELRKEELPLCNGQVNFPVGPHKIITLELLPS